MIVLAMMVGGGLGAVTRFVLDALMRTRKLTTAIGPTAIINILGSLLIGLIAGWATTGSLDSNWNVIIATGFCGGFTTFSTSMYETLFFGLTPRAVVYQASTLAGSVVACLLGLALTL